jgi:hypothetical protein
MTMTSPRVVISISKSLKDPVQNKVQLIKLPVNLLNSRPSLTVLNFHASMVFLSQNLFITDARYDCKLKDLANCEILIIYPLEIFR